VDPSEPTALRAVWPPDAATRPKQPPDLKVELECGLKSGTGSSVEELVGKVLGGETSEEPSDSPRELQRKAPSGDNDARVVTTRFKPAVVQTLEIDAVVGQEDAARVRGKRKLFLV